MTFTIEIDERLKARLDEEAGHRGVGAAEYARQLIEQSLAAGDGARWRGIDERARSSSGPLRRSLSVDELAKQQGVTAVVPFEQLLGGWPEGEEHDGFEEAVARWRAEEPRRGEF